ncbi:hypothetical protein [Bradyrhizobium sp. CCBAU 43298]|uniref:hypothetical protein n=1 Tax=Bradyrhizobium TaxID=374 RepID=UPI0004B1D6CC|nr:hypothetical protein [Bradyrhizobium sp. CCBAU 43298]
MITAEQIIIERDDGLYEVGLHQPIGPFETRQFALAVAAHETAPSARLHRNSRHREDITNG